MIYICEYCYRECEEKDMKKNAIGEISKSCNTCISILGKGPGYSNNFMSRKDEEKWFDGISERKEKLKQEGKL